MVTKQSFVVFFFKWVLGVHQPVWDIEGGAQESAALVQYIQYSSYSIL